MTLHDSETPKMTPNCSKLIPEIHPKWSKPNSVDSKNAPRNALLSFIAHAAHHVLCHFRVIFVVILWSSSDRSGVILGTFDFTLGSFRGHFVVILGSFWGLSGLFLEHFWDRFRGHSGDIFRVPMVPKTFQTAPKLTPKVPQVDPR